MAEIKDVKVWSNATKTEWRVYVHTADGREGCKYTTGNKWNPKGSITGDLTDEEWEQARAVAVWDKKWHTIYPDQAQEQTVKPQGSREPEIRKNRRAQHCAACGRMVAAGEGWLSFVDEEDTQLGPTGWLVYHLDKDLCQSYREQDKAEDKARKEYEEALKIEAQELSAKVAAETGLTEQFDWSWDDYRFSLGKPLAESENYIAREYKESDNIIGFAVKKKDRRS